MAANEIYSKRSSFQFISKDYGPLTDNG